MIKESLMYIDSLKQEASRLEPIKKEDKERLLKKFHLEWNYNSNHLEGNTFTYKDTELLLILKKDNGNYTEREREEMKAHDVAIKLVEELSKNKEVPLTESFISHLNEVILVKPFLKEGKGGVFQVIPGKYKREPNSVIRAGSGELHHFPSPQETVAMMGDLMKLYNTHNVSTETHPVWLAAIMHYTFVQIHPFDDGNGRVARLLMNYVLLKNNYPPVIIKSNEKSKYLIALEKADNGNLEAFVLYIIEQLRWSLNLTIRAAEGKSIEEEEDLDKRLTILKKSMDSKTKIVTKKKSVTQHIIANFYIPLLNHLNERLSKHEDFFQHHSWNLVDQSLGEDMRVNLFKTMLSPRVPQHFNNLIKEIEKLNSDGLDYGFEVIRDFIKFNSEDDSFDLSISVDIKFREKYFQITTFVGTPADNNEAMRKVLLAFNNKNRITHKEFQEIYYNQEINNNTIKEIVREIVNLSVDYIEKETEELDKRRN